MQPLVIKWASGIAVGCLGVAVMSETFHFVKCDQELTVTQYCRSYKLEAVQPHTEINSTAPASPTYVVSAASSNSKTVAAASKASVEALQGVRSI
jgi:hypothetical protein